MTEKLFALINTFIDVQGLTLETLGNGHINDTYAVLDKRQKKYVLQRINSRIFPEPLKVMENLKNLNDFLRGNFPLATFLNPLKNKKQQLYTLDENNDVWRMFDFIPGAITVDVVETEVQAEETARAFAEYQFQLLHYDGPQLHETIKDFHHTPKRYESFEEALATGDAQRRSKAEKEISWLKSHQSISTKLADLHTKGDIPLRITHNDSKLQNLLLDQESQRSLCVIDLDTVMPGLSLYDFGDLMRSTTSPVAEDEEDLSKVTMQMDMFKAIARGYFSVARNFLTATEVENIPFSGMLITYENALRFLTDYLMGDVYYKTHKDDHNLWRCRTQIELVKSMLKHEVEMCAYIQTLAGAVN